MNRMQQEDMLALAGGGKAWSRRDFIASSVATGFALAVQPVCAQTRVVTDAQGLTAGMIEFQSRDGYIPAYRALPAKGKDLPIVLVVQEIFGVHEHIKDVCRRFAKLGYLAIAPDLYFREGDVSQLKDTTEIFEKVVNRIADAQVLADLDGAAVWASRNRGNGAKLAITGFCWGGRFTWLYAAHNANLKAGVAWYGRLAGDKSELTPEHAIDVVEKIKAPVLGLYGGADAGIPVESVDRMRDALKAAGSRSELVVYPDTPHAFHADYRPSYRKAAAEDGWKRAIAWFKQHGVA